MFFTRRKTETILALRAGLARLTSRVEAVETAPRPAADLSAARDLVETVTAAVASLKERVDELTIAHHELRDGHKDLLLAVSEGIERTERAERRVQATVKRARKELADRGLSDPGLEAEDAELSEINAERGGNGGLQPVRREVAPIAPTASSIRGVPVETLRRVRGY